MPLTETDPNRAVTSANNTQVKSNIQHLLVFRHRNNDKENAPTNTPSNRASTTKSASTNSPKTIDSLRDIDPDNHDEFPIRYNCNQIRTRLNRLTTTGGMKIGELQRKLGVSSKSYNSFLRMSGPHAGMGNNTYVAGHLLFAAMEDNGISMPKASTSTKKAGTTKKGEDKTTDITAIHLSGEESGTVPIYDTCDDIRNKINAHLRSAGTTQASFCREISACQGRDATPIQSGQVTSFLRKKGPMAGNTRGKKSKKREEVEEVWKQEGGANTTIANETRGVWATGDENVSMNKYGKIEITSKGGRVRSSGYYS
ncbi:hypothetical protein PMZ80_000863 [Knufia obscura]|uniref:DUF7726 domain-containing protein n=1 Tax=Knufia obscura TaxID=1635080 RepID=A0ABR0S1L3_9EURO|nr:hypothetical protein PMZ80_000863 [Knufia obscura]